MISAKELKELSSSLNILYAEDEEMLRESMQITLAKLFKNIYVAKNGQEAFEHFKKEDIDLVVTDINMPIMSGIELISSIHKYSDEEVFITVVSAHTESKLLTSLINMGINSFLNKPLDKQHLINSLYKTCKVITDRKLLKEYELQLQSELLVMDRKNKILEQKLNQLAVQTNKNVKNTTNVKGTFEKKEVIKENSDNYYETLLRDDKDELSDLSTELDSFIALMFQGQELNKDYLIKLSDVYRKYSSTISTYPEFFEIATFLQDFSHAILNLEEKFMQNLEQTGTLFESLQLTLENYRENIWNKKAKNPRFYNASLVNDIQLVIDFLEDKEIKDSEIEFF